MTILNKIKTPIINDTIKLKACIINKYAVFNKEKCDYEIALETSSEYNDKNIYDTIYLIYNCGNYIVLNGRYFFEDISYFLKDSFKSAITQAKLEKLENFDNFIPTLNSVLKLRQMCFRIDKIGENQIRVYICNGLYRDIDLDNGNLFLYQMVVGGSLKKLKFKSTED